MLDTYRKAYFSPCGQYFLGTPWPHPGKTFQGEYLPVLTKKDFVRRYAYGEFGNCSPTWNTFEEFEAMTRQRYPSSTDAWNSEERFHLRNRTVAGETFYNLRPYYAFLNWCNFKHRGLAREWYCSQMAPTHLTLINGEVMQSENGLELFYSTVKKPMRDSLREGGKRVTGVVASTILKHFMNAKSYDWFQVLLDRYPFHVVEFSSYDVCWGTLEGYNTCFWEVRTGY